MSFPEKSGLAWARGVCAPCNRRMVHPSVYGLPALRAEIAAYFQVSRGINCSPSQIFVTSGYRHSIELIAHALLKAEIAFGLKTLDIRQRENCWAI